MSRNPVAGNAWKYNKSRVIPNKRKESERRVSKNNRYFETDYDDYDFKSL